MEPPGWAIPIPWPGHVVLIKSPSWPLLYSERAGTSVKTIPLGFGWRITIRRKVDV